MPFEPTLDSTSRLALPCLACDIDALAPELPEALEDMDRLVEQNFQSELFVSPEVIDQESQRRLQEVLRPKITLQTIETESAEVTEQPQLEQKPGKPPSSQTDPVA